MHDDNMSVCPSVLSSSPPPLQNHMMTQLRHAAHFY